MRRLLSILITFLFVAMFVACGGDDNDNPQPKTMTLNLRAFFNVTFDTVLEDPNDPTSKPRYENLTRNTITLDFTIVSDYETKTVNIPIENTSSTTIKYLNADSDIVVTSPTWANVTVKAGAAGEGANVAVIPRTGPGNIVGIREQINGTFARFGNSENKNIAKVFIPEDTQGMNDRPWVVEVLQETDPYPLCQGTYEITNVESEAQFIAHLNSTANANECQLQGEITNGHVYLTDRNDPKYPLTKGAIRREFSEVKISSDNSGKLGYVGVYDGGGRYVTPYDVDFYELHYFVKNTATISGDMLINK